MPNGRIQKRVIATLSQGDRIWLQGEFNNLSSRIRKIEERLFGDEEEYEEEYEE